MKLNLSKILLYYSLVLSTLMFIGGWYAAKGNFSTILSNILFLPIVIYLWTALWKSRKE